MINEDFKQLEALGKLAWKVYRGANEAPYWDALPRPAQERWVEVAAELWSIGFEEGVKHGEFLAYFKE